MTETSADDPELPGYSEAEDGLTGDPDEAEGAVEDETEDDGEAEPDDPHGTG